MVIIRLHPRFSAGSGRGRVVKVLDSGLLCREFVPHTGHDSLLVMVLSADK